MGNVAAGTFGYYYQEPKYSAIEYIFLDTMHAIRKEYERGRHDIPYFAIKKVINELEPTKRHRLMKLTGMQTQGKFLDRHEIDILICYFMQIY